jgi:hypothetical protein
MGRLVHVIERPRPFVRSANYVGPDRRRHDSETYNGPERRKDRARLKPDIAADKVTAGLEWNLDAMSGDTPALAKV